MEKHYIKIIYGLMGAVVGLVIFIYTTGVGSQREDIVEAKNIAQSASKASQANIETIIAIQGQYNLIQAQLNWVINALDKNGIRGSLPIPDGKRIVSEK